MFKIDSYHAQTDILERHIITGEKIVRSYTPNWFLIISTSGQKGRETTVRGPGVRVLAMKAT